MKETKTLYEIKEAEAKAKRILEKANQQKLEAVADAKKEALSIIEKAEEKADKGMAEQIGQCEWDIEKRKGEMGESNAKLVQKMQRRAKQQMDVSTKFVVSEFKREAKRC